ncbi:hypothetical protein [Vibrio phage BONAISHI]|nr:hypothetical protein [Vibrio phage BONAISHI]
MFHPLINIDPSTLNSVALVRPNWPFSIPNPRTESKGEITAGMRNSLYICDNESANTLMSFMSISINALYGLNATPRVERPLIARIHTNDFNTWQEAFDSGVAELAKLNKSSLGVSQGFPVMPVDSNHAAQVQIIIDFIGDFDQKSALASFMPELRTLTQDRIGLTMFINRKDVTEDLKDLFDIVWDTSMIYGTAADPAICGNVVRSIYGETGIRRNLFLENYLDAIDPTKTPSYTVKPSEVVRELIERYDYYILNAFSSNPYLDVIENLNVEMERLRDLRKASNKKRMYGRAMKILADYHGTINYKNWVMQ